MDTAQSFTARRSAASNLPTFQLPPPDLANMHNKYPSYNATTTAQAVASILTPPSGVPADLSPISSSVTSGSSSSSAGIAPYSTPQGYWPAPNPNYTFNGTAPPQMPAPFQQNPIYMGRQLYSPQSLGGYNGHRGSGSPTASEGLPPPPYEINNLPPFPSGGGGSAQQSSLPTLAPQQQQQHMSNMMMGSQQPASQAPQQGSIHASDNYGARPPPTPTYSNYAPATSTQQSSFPAYTQASPTQQSPITTGPPQNRISPVSAHPPSAMQPPPGQYSRPYGGYPLPAMSGPIMSNMHNPGNQMALVGSMNMGYPPQHMQQHMYGQHQQQQQNDRPFKCDQCPQSFNRNHDLKRHKRIHLAVKPFPCTHCEKSFSRKDALKRHILVKGCGKTGATVTVTSTGSQSPQDKSEIMSNSSNESPQMTKTELQ